MSDHKGRSPAITAAIIGAIATLGAAGITTYFLTRPDLSLVVPKNGESSESDELKPNVERNRKALDMLSGGWLSGGGSTSVQKERHLTALRALALLEGSPSDDERDAMVTELEAAVADSAGYARIGSNYRGRLDRIRLGIISDAI